MVVPPAVQQQHEAGGQEFAQEGNEQGEEALDVQIGEAIWQAHGNRNPAAAGARPLPAAHPAPLPLTTSCFYLQTGSTSF